VSAFGYKGGHLVVYDSNIDGYVYADTKESIKIERPCIRCGKMPTKEGHDACLGTLPGVKNACCGHGVEQGYLEFDNGAHFILHFHQKNIPRREE